MNIYLTKGVCDENSQDINLYTNPYSVWTLLQFHRPTVYDVPHIKCFVFVWLGFRIIEVRFMFVNIWKWGLRLELHCSNQRFLIWVMPVTWLHRGRFMMEGVGRGRITCSLDGWFWLWYWLCTSWGAIYITVLPAD